MESISFNTTSYHTIDYEAGQRIDNFLLAKLKVPKSKIYSILRKGEVRVNKGRIKPSYKLQLEDVVRIPPIRTSMEKKYELPSYKAQELDLEKTVIYEDKNLIIINKPAGLAVHGGSGVSFGLIEALRVIRPHDKNLELVHRLDRDTSGCIMIAKKRSMLRGLHELLRERKIQKDYHLIVEGKTESSFMVTEPLLKIEKSGERIVVVSPEGQRAKSKFKVLEKYKYHTLLQGSPITGRTHQLRVHAAHCGYPIMGDRKYGSGKGSKRLYLHARQLVFDCPLTNQPIMVQAEYDQDFNTMRDRLNERRH